jgi:hypothetical protein
MTGRTKRVPNDANITGPSFISDGLSIRSVNTPAPSERKGKRKGVRNLFSRDFSKRFLTPFLFPFVTLAEAEASLERQVRSIDFDALTRTAVAAAWDRARGRM